MLVLTLGLHSGRVESLLSLLVLALAPSTESCIEDVSPPTVKGDVIPKYEEWIGRT